MYYARYNKQLFIPAVRLFDMINRSGLYPEEIFCYADLQLRQEDNGDFELIISWGELLDHEQTEPAPVPAEAAE